LFETKKKTENSNQIKNDKTPKSTTPQPNKNLCPLPLSPGVAIIVEISWWMLVMEDNIYLA